MVKVRSRVPSRLRALSVLVLLCLVALSPLWHQEHRLTDCRALATHGRHLRQVACEEGARWGGSDPATCPICLSQHLLALSLMGHPIELDAPCILLATFSHPTALPSITVPHPHRPRAPPLA